MDRKMVPFQGVNSPCLKVWGRHPFFQVQVFRMVFCLSHFLEIEWNFSLEIANIPEGLKRMSTTSFFFPHAGWSLAFLYRWSTRLRSPHRWFRGWRHKNWSRAACGILPRPGDLYFRQWQPAGFQRYERKTLNGFRISFFHGFSYGSLIADWAR